MTNQHGLVTRAQAVEAGLTERELRTLTAVAGPWVAVRRGVYVERPQWEEAEPRDGRLRLADRAAHLAMRKPHVLSHDSAARVHRVPMLSSPGGLVHVTRPGVSGSRTEHGVRHHLTRYWSMGVVVDGLPVTTLARTVLDLAREHGITSGVVAADHALQHGVTQTGLEVELQRMWSWPHVTRARAAIALSDPGAESPGETLARLLVTELGLGVPRSQFAVRTTEGTVWCDLRLGCHVFEFDGRIKVQRREEGGVATRPATDVVWDDRKRDRLVAAEGLGISHIVWDDFWGERRKQALARLRAEVAVTRDRFGLELPPHLAEYSARRPRRRR